MMRSSGIGCGPVGVSEWSGLTLFWGKVGLGVVGTAVHTVGASKWLNELPVEK